jgi:hypothetical protein
MERIEAQKPRHFISEPRRLMTEVETVPLGRDLFARDQFGTSVNDHPHGEKIRKKCETSWMTNLTCLTNRLTMSRLQTPVHELWLSRHTPVSARVTPDVVAH